LFFLSFQEERKIKKRRRSKKNSLISHEQREKRREFLNPRGASISQPAYRPLNQRRIIRTQSTIDKKKRAK
jgi:hypothetical protein